MSVEGEELIARAAKRADWASKAMIAASEDLRASHLAEFRSEADFLSASGGDCRSLAGDTGAQWVPTGPRSSARSLAGRSLPGATAAEAVRDLPEEDHVERDGEVGRDGHSRHGQSDEDRDHVDAEDTQERR